MPQREESWHSLPVRFDEIRQLITNQTADCLKEINKTAASWAKQPKPIDDQFEERLKEAVRSVFVEAFQQQLGTSGPGEIKQMLGSIQNENTASIKREVEGAFELLRELLERKLNEVTHVLNEISRFPNLVTEYERLKPEVEKARQDLAERDKVNSERDRAIETIDAARKLEKFLADVAEQIREERKKIKTNEMRNEALSHELNERQRQLDQREEELQPKERVLTEEKKRLDESSTAVTAREQEISRQREEWEAARATQEFEMKALAEQVEKTRQETMERQTETQRIYSETLVLLRQFWPEFVLVAEWDDWRATLQKEAASSNPNANVLLGAVHVFSAAFQGGQRELLFDCLRQIGILYYRLLKDRRLDEIAAFQEIDRLAKHLNHHSQQRFRLEVARPGQPTDGSWMNFEPGLSTVGSVSSWAVFDPAESGPRHRAIVQSVNNGR